MRSAEKEIKRSSKFNYLVQEENKQKLSKYDKLNFSPKIKRNYQQTIQEASLEKEKENKNQNIMKRIKSNAKGYNASIDQQSSHKHGLISFGKNKDFERLNQFEKSKENNPIYKDELQKKANKEKYDNEHRIRTKSFGSIGFKHPFFEPKDSQEKDLLEFSPYNEEMKFSCEGVKLGRSRIEFESYINGIANQGQNLLIYELQQQQLIVRKQLKEYEYQNELLKQRIQFLEKENITLEQLNEQNTIELKEKDLFYQRKLNSLTLDIKELEEQNKIWKLENEQLLCEINSEKRLVSEFQEELHILSTRNQELEILLSSKDAVILDLKTKIELFQIDQLNSIETEQNKRRKSLDLSAQARRYVKEQKPSNYESIEEGSSQLSKTFQIGKLMNKTSNQTINLKGQSRLHPKDPSTIISLKHNSISPNKSLTIQKYINLIESAKSMYYKVTGQKSGDLKELWKWLKMITHEYQSFVGFYSMKDQILAVLEDMENRLDTSKIEDQLSFMDKECYKIIKKLASVVAKEQ